MAATPNRPSALRPSPTQKSAPVDTRSAFSKAREAAQATVSGLSFYTSEAKERMYNDLVPFWLHSASVVKGQFGEQWYLVISENDPSTDQGTLTLARNTYRDTLFEELSGILSASGNPIGPLLLSKVITKAGQNSWDVIEWTES